MTLFRIDASIRTEGSASREIADIVEAEWRTVRPGDAVIARHLGTDPLPAEAWTKAIFASWTPAAERTADQSAALAVGAELVDELVAADAIVIATPLYNFGVSQHVKTWIDLIITDPRAGAGAPPLLAGKPVVLVVVRGGSYAAGTPREGWDHNTGDLQQILGQVWGANLTIVEREFTLVGVNPALDEFKELADKLNADAKAAAIQAGQAIAVASLSRLPQRGGLA